GGGVAEDCGLVLGAIIDSYRDFLDETYRNVSDNTLELITKARDILEKDLAEKEKKYRAFREESPLLWRGGKDGLTFGQTRLADIDSKRSALLVRAAELRERLQALTEAREQDGGRAAL